MSKKDLIFTGGKSSLSLAEKMRQGIQSIREEKRAIKAQEGVVLLLDMSYSMMEYVQGKPKVSHLREAIANYPSLRKVSFNSLVMEGDKTEPNYNTNMEKAFQYLSSCNPKEVILISDGLPNEPYDDPQGRAINAAKALRCPVNVIYIGPGGDEGEEFMKRLAAETGGKQVTADTRLYQDFGHQLSANIHLMLPASIERR